MNLDESILKTEDNNEIGTIVLLHGYGADSSDMESMRADWQAQFSKWKVVALNGPIDLKPGYAWFDLYAENWLDEMQSSGKYLENHFKNYDKKLIFAGFSQGGFLTSYMSLFSDLIVSAGISFSGGIVPVKNDQGREHDAKKTPMLLIHGDEDRVILQEWYDQSISYAKENDLPVSGLLIEDMNHEINEEAYKAATEYLQKIINPSC